MLYMHMRMRNRRDPPPLRSSRSRPVFAPSFHRIENLGRIHQIPRQPPQAAPCSADRPCSHCRTIFGLSSLLLLTGHRCGVPLACSDPYTLNC